MHHGMLRAQTGGTLRAAAQGLGDLAIPRRQGQVHGLAGGARSAVQARHDIARRSQVIAEGRSRRLRQSQLRLGGQG